jgi:SHS2 domain-containing protein
LSFQLIDHTADIIIRGEGKDLAQAFVQGAYGLYEVMTERSAISPSFEKNVTIKSEDKGALLYDWISELIYLFDTESFLASKITIKELKQTDKGQFILKATLQGETFDENKHERESEVKAMTYSFMEITDNSVEFTLDL